MRESGMASAPQQRAPLFPIAHHQQHDTTGERRDTENRRQRNRLLPLDRGVRFDRPDLEHFLSAPRPVSDPLIGERDNAEDDEDDSDDARRVSSRLIRGLRALMFFF